MADVKQVLGQLEKYGLTENESRVYLYLLRQASELSVVQIARSLKLGRTPIYNALNKLETKGLISRTVAENGHNYTAAAPDRLEHYWHSKMRHMQQLGEGLSPLVGLLGNLSTSSGYKSQIEYYSGKKGLEQITYNSLRAKNDLYIYEIKTTMVPFVDYATSEKFREIWAERSTTIHQLTNSTAFEDFTSIERLITDLWDIRHIDPETLTINFETLIYNDTVALYSPVGHEIFGVEIKNQNLAQMQVQIFKAMQRLATPLTKHSSRGAASVVITE
jgi:Predicted transcriptional regulators